MTKTILIATDFSLESLDILKKVLRNKSEQNDTNRYNIVFVSGYDMGDSIRDLLFTSKTSLLGKIRSQEFCDAYSIIYNKYPDLINKVSCEVFTGSFQRSFNQFADAITADEAYISTAKLRNLKKAQFDITPYIKKCRHLDVVEIATTIPEFAPERGRLAEVFL